MGDTQNGEKARKMVFVTVGTTLFDALVRAVDSWEVKQELLKRGYSNLVIQMGRGSYTPTKEISSTNKDNRNKSKIFSTTGFVPMAKYKYEMYLETGSKPSPIDCFKKFHTKKDGKEWATDHAKTLYEKMDAIKAKALSEGTKTNDYQIFREVVGEPSHGCILGMGIRIKVKDVANIAEKILQKKKKI